MRKLVGYLADNPTRVVRIGRERLRELLAAHDVTFQRTKTWKESNDPDRDTKLARIEDVLDEHPGPVLRVRRVRAVGDPPSRRLLLVRHEGTAAAAGELPQALRGPAVPRLLLGR